MKKHTLITDNCFGELFCECRECQAQQRTCRTLHNQSISNNKKITISINEWQSSQCGFHVNFHVNCHRIKSADSNSSNVHLPLESSYRTRLKRPKELINRVNNIKWEFAELINECIMNNNNSFWLSDVGSWLWPCVPKPHQRVNNVDFDVIINSLTMHIMMFTVSGEWRTDDDIVQS